MLGWRPRRVRGVMQTVPPRYKRSAFRGLNGAPKPSLKFQTLT
ncbi:hypothetical protein M2281_005476 [Mesorhizobium soli]|nr:hypothetical protein [Mesorhizobium soli]